MDNSRDKDYGLNDGEIRTYEENPYAGNLSSGNDTEFSDVSEVTSDTHNKPVDECSYEWYGSDVTENMPVKRSEEVPQSQKQKRKGKGYVALLLVGCILLSSVFGGVSALAVCLVYGAVNSVISRDSGVGVTINRVEAQDGATAVSGETLTTTQIVEKTADSVVEIMTESVKTGVFTQQYIKSGAGSGVVIDKAGYVVTNFHVIENASKITVTLRSGESSTAEIVGADEQSDLALLKIQAENLTPATFGNSDNLKVGEQTVAIGNPLGQLGGSVTEGILSALDRDVVVDGKTMSLLQTDTAINPGNSGGGLFNSQGLLIGIVSAKSTGSEVEGLGFAIPINDAIDIISDLAEFGYVRGRVDLGVEFIDVDSVQLAWMYGLSEMGCYVYDVESDSSAWQSGLKTGDLVLKVNDIDISTGNDIEEIVKVMSVGDTVTFTVKRNGESKNISVVLEEYVPKNAESTDNSYLGKPVEWDSYY
ncbi:MAG: trypsin-like peptidase domain-containing protein [Eubacteriales bacterium]|nr:trypsin-like peptidase domain-containing protein [Eubacteriales bacterium]